MITPLDISVEMLEGLLEGGPVCEAFIPVSTDWVECGIVAVARIKTTCIGCGYVKIGYVCAGHLEEMKTTGMACMSCEGDIHLDGEL
jgi:hypothetical protein